MSCNPAWTMSFGFLFQTLALQPVHGYAYLPIVQTVIFGQNRSRIQPSESHSSNTRNA